MTFKNNINWVHMYNVHMSVYCQVQQCLYHWWINMERPWGWLVLKTGGGRTLCTLHRGEGLYAYGYVATGAIWEIPDWKLNQVALATQAGLYTGEGPSSIVTLWYICPFTVNCTEQCTVIVCIFVYMYYVHEDPYQYQISFSVLNFTQYDPN